MTFFVFPRSAVSRYDSLGSTRFAKNARELQRCIEKKRGWETAGASKGSLLLLTTHLLQAYKLNFCLSLLLPSI